MTVSTAIVGGQIIDGTGRDPIRDGLVLVEHGKIVRVGKANGGAIPKDATVVDAGGASVLPGLMDAHVHISLSAPADLAAEILSRPIGRVAFEVANNLRETVAAGVTTLRTVSDIAHLDIAARDAIRRGIMVGPRIFPCGKGLTTTGGHGQILPCWVCMSHGDISEVVDGPDAIRAAVRRQVQAGAQWIKLFQTGGVIDPHGRIDAEEFSPAEFDVAVETAKLAGLPVAVHAHNKTAILRSIRAGCRSIEHGMHFDEECAEAARDRGTFLVPTLTVMDRILQHGPQAGIPAFMIDNVRARTTKHHDYVRYAHGIGANIACGTDAGSLLTPHGSAGREVGHLVDCGLSVLQAIQVATHNTARLLMAEREIGSLEAGKFADLIVVEGDVIADVRAIEVAGNMRHVLIAGREVASRGKVLPV
ncbi:MAG: amidohydrolase family protein [Pseudomonadota bacterium]